MKVDEQAEFPSAKFQIAEQLSLMNGQQDFDGFHFHHDHARYKKVQPIPAVEFHSFVIDMQRFLSLEGDLPQRKLMRQTLFVSRFQ